MCRSNSMKIIQFATDFQDIDTDFSKTMDLWVKERVLGAGSFGIVTLWKNSHNNQKLALKQCRHGLEITLTENQKKRWRKEIEIMVKLQHQNIVRAIEIPKYFGIALKSSLPVLCMEYCSGGDLRQALNQPQNCCGLAEKEVRNFLLHIKNALQYLHKQSIIHRDLKPENILRQEISGSIVYKLTDLGYAKELEQNGICSSFVGTLQYLAPELVLNATYNNAVDYWSFGLVSHEVITGIRPFLPQSHPTIWLNYVKNKRSEHICIYQSTNGCIRYSSRLFQENQISQCFQHEIERWLQLSLEWDFEKRGVSKLGQDILFTRLDEILNKKILTLFCSSTYTLLSYEVDKSTAISTLRGWIVRDTKIPPELQVLLSFNGIKIDDNKLAVSYYVKDKEVMIYVYHIKPIVLPSLKIKVPGLVMKMMENPLAMLNHFYLKRTIAQAIHFMRSELNLFLTFLNAYKIKLACVDNIAKNLNQLNENMLMELNKILSNRKMCEKLLNFDVKCYIHLSDQPLNKNIDNATDIASQWQTNFNRVSEKINQLLSTFYNLKMKCDKQVKEALIMKDEFKLEGYEISKFTEYLKLAYQCFERLPTDREKLSTPVEVMKIIYDFLGLRSVLLKSDNFNAHLQNLWRNETELEDISVSMYDLKDRILVAKSDIMNIQFSRHKDIWQLIANSVMEPLQLEMPTLDVTKPIFDCSSSTLNVDSGFMDHSKGFDCGNNFSDSLKSSSETETILSDNKSIRCKMLDNLEEMIHKYRVIKDESESIDWTFLNTDEKKN